MGRAWRIVKEKHAAIAFDGEGARLYGGRWNPAGTRLVYTSGSRALAALENLVHLNPPVTFRYVIVAIEFDDALVERFAARKLPADWAAEPPPPSALAIGDLWVKEGRSPVLEVPSAIIRTESNYLVNPAHRDFTRIKIRKPEAFSFDPRLI